MGKNVHDNVLDAALNYIKTNATKLIVLTAEPVASAYVNATTAKDSSGYKLADVSITSANFTGPANGDTSGRKIQVNAQSSISIDGIAASSSATHVCLVDDSTSTVLYTTTCTSQNLTGGNKVNTPAWDIEIRDPA